MIMPQNESARHHKIKKKLCLNQELPPEAVRPGRRAGSDGRFSA
jgi:hypothetical protein